MSVTWNANAGQQTEDAAWEGIQRATVFAHSKMLAELNVPNPGQRVKRKRNTVAGPKGSTYTVYPYPSNPGEPPRKRTAWLQGHVLYALDRQTLTGRIGVAQAALYGLFLDAGTRKMDPRPWAMATVTKYLAQIRLQALGRAG